MPKFVLPVVSAGLALLAAGAFGHAAQASIVCRDGFQINYGRAISTPYCNDALVAAVAREHGFKVSDGEIRNNPSRKNEVCRFVGDDIRINHYCPDNDTSTPDR
jgi:hypothetical protein